MAKRKKKINKPSSHVPNAIQDLLDIDADLNTGSLLNSDAKLLPSLLEEDKALRKMELDLNAIIDDVLASKDIVPRDLKFDDSSMPKAKNYYDWVTSEEFLGSDMPPYLEQALIGIKLFAEYCPDCSDLEWMEDGNHEAREGLAGFDEHVQVLEHGVCPKCDGRRSHFMREGKLNFYNELALNAGQRSGKSALVAMIATYQLHKILKAQKPNQLFRVKSSNMFHGTFVALTFAQAKDTLWEPFYNNITESPWFQKYHILLREYEHKYGQEIFKFKDTFIMYRHRSIMFYPAGPDKRTLRGRTRLFACIPGDQLISTDRGLIRMKDIYVGERANVGHRSAPITVHETTGTKRTYDVYLATGQKFSCTDNHKIGVYRDNKFKKVMLKDLSVGDHVIVPRGGEFPTRLDLSKYVTEHTAKDTRQHIIYAAVDKLEAFDYPILLQSTGLNSGFAKNVVSSLVKDGYLNRVYRKGQMFEGMSRTYYTKTTEFNLTDLILSTSNDRHHLNLPTEMTTDLASLIGYLIADGDLTDNNLRGFKFDTSHEERYLDFCEKFERTFNIECKTMQWEKDGTPIYRATFSHRQIIKYLVSIGLKKKYSADKKIPWSILQAPEDCAKAFIKSAFECDGAIRNKTVIYRSTSKKLMRQIQMLLARLDILVSFRRVQTGKYKTSYKVPWKYGNKTVHLYKMVMGKEPSIKFDTSIGFEFKNTDSIYTYNGKEHDHYLKTMRNDLFTAPIKRITKGRKVKVYDMTVDLEEHAYSAGGVLVSNSIDEIAYFDNDKNSSKVKLSASEVYIALERSLRTARNSEERMIANEYDEAFTGIFANVSSPVSQRDKVCELVKQSVGSKKMLGVHKPTWEMNPDVTREALHDEFRKDYATAMRDYGAEPPLSANPFITSPVLVENIIKESGRNYATVRSAIYRAKDKSKQRYGYIDKVKPIEGGSVSIMAIDAGFSHDCFAVAVGSLQWRETDAGQFLIPSIDILLEINPLPNIPLHYPKIYENIMEPLIKERNVQILVADRWQSIKLLQDAEQDHDLEVVKQYSLKYSDFIDIKTRMQQQQLWIPRPTKLTDFDDILSKSTDDDYPKCFEGMPIEHVILQMLSVQAGQANVTKGEGLTDDLWRAMSLATWGLNNPEYAEILQKKLGNGGTATKQALGTMKTGAAGTGSVRTPSNAFGVVKARR